MDKQGESILPLAMLTLSVGVILIKRRRHIKWRNRRWGSKPVNRLRDTEGEFTRLFQEIKFDEEKFFEYTMMSLDTFNHLLSLVYPFLKKKSRRKPICPEERLAMTLRYLSSGNTIKFIARCYHMGHSTALVIIKDTCTVLTNVLTPRYLSQPTEKEWKITSTGFLRDCNLPNCVGAIGCKEVVIEGPFSSNNGKNFDVVFLAICDTNYKFTAIDVGDYGSCIDGGVFKVSKLGKSIKEGTLNLPRDTAKLPRSDVAFPYFLVGNKEFQLRKHLMKPYPIKNLDERNKIFNYRLSRASRVIENTFGILAARWRIFRGPININPNDTYTIIKATVCLHNFLISRDNVSTGGTGKYCPPDFIDRETEDGTVEPGGWREFYSGAFLGLNRIGANHAAADAYKARDDLSHYLLTPEGEIPGQWKYIKREQSGMEWELKMDP